MIGSYHPLKGVVGEYNLFTGWLAVILSNLCHHFLSIYLFPHELAGHYLFGLLSFWPDNESSHMEVYYCRGATLNCFHSMACSTGLGTVLALS